MSSTSAWTSPTATTPGRSARCCRAGGARPSSSSRRCTTPSATSTRMPRRAVRRRRGRPSRPRPRSTRRCACRRAAGRCGPGCPSRPPSMTTSRPTPRAASSRAPRRRRPRRRCAPARHELTRRARPCLAGVRPGRAAVGEQLDDGRAALLVAGEVGRYDAEHRPSSSTTGTASMPCPTSSSAICLNGVSGAGQHLPGHRPPTVRMASSATVARRRRGREAPATSDVPLVTVRPEA